MTPPASPPPVPAAPSPGRRPETALAWCAAAAVLILVWLVHRLATGLFLGVLMGFALEPLYVVLRRRIRRPGLASIATVALAIVALVGVLVGFASLFVTRATAMAGALGTAIGPGGALRPWVTAASARLARFGLSLEQVPERLREAAAAIASQSASFAAAGALATASTLLGAFFALLAMHVTLRHWPRAVAGLEAVAPLRPEHTRALLEAFRRAGRQTLLGTVGTGVAQGALAALGYWISGVPEAAFFGVMTAIASVVPVVGTLLVWVPAGLYLILTGQLGWGIAELAWGTLVVVGFSDYVIRPWLVGDEDMPLLLTFLALFGGLEVMGVIGLLVGPVVMAVAVAALRLYARARAAAPLSGAAPPWAG